VSYRADPTTDRLPLDAETRKPLKPRPQPGYYPGYDVVSQQSFWDGATRELVLKRLNPAPPLRFFNPQEAELMRVVCDHILPQDDRDPGHRIEIVPNIDERLFNKKGPGYCYENMPPDDEAYRLFLQALELMGQANYGRPFLDLTWREQEEILQALNKGKPQEGAGEIWKRLSVPVMWTLLVGDCITAYYQHPWSWSEIGYGGPAYPRAYMRLERGQPEPWEVEEQRYAWEAPPGSLSDLDENSHHDYYPHLSHGGVHD
jgi:hypothetical protein